MKLILGIVIIVLVILSFIRSIVKTPVSLRGYYGKWYLILSSIGVIAGILLIVF